MSYKMLCHFKINHLHVRGEIQRKYKFHLDLYPFHAQPVLASTRPSASKPMALTGSRLYISGDEKNDHSQNTLFY